ncbi:hypothetical protein PA0543 [Candidatus Phytoplasma australiense]|uniref:Uncharacterized protein n=2 Tax=Phytoplasma australiense TaxID=59748 RepID=B1VAA4_PHYAS|nr:hypothetical protein PA0543 [Candidatus Phytoplasma australiense]
MGLITYNYLKTYENAKYLKYNIPILNKLTRPTHQIAPEVEANNVQSFVFLSSFCIMFLAGLLWAIGFYWYLSLLKFTTIILSVGWGYFFGAQYALFQMAFNIKSNYIALFFYIPFLGTLLVVGLMSYLYYSKKLVITPQKRYLIAICFIIFYFVSISLNLYRRPFSFWWIHIIILLWSILGLVISAFIWVLMLEQVDIFVEK